ncbi:MAG: DNA polymerase III subunit delta' [Alphaproteobacteria bacterium]|nr:DNA polymerase III subunit delta' [Alphaproteobacteria bacterium]
MKAPRKKSEPALSIRLPRQTDCLFGHGDAETMMLDAYRSGRIAHAWLIEGPQGIGKATLAYRMARFVLAHGEPSSPAVQRAESLAVDPNHPVAHQVASGAHGALLAIERVENEKKKTGELYTVIRVEESRGVIPFFGATASGEGWRVCIVDTVDELNDNAANALLKALEEPPRRSLFLLVSNSPARALATIKSRCRRLRLRPLLVPDVIRAAATAAALDANDPHLRDAAEASEGRVAQALTLMGGGALELQQRVAALLARLPQVDGAEMHALGDSLGSADRAALAVFVDGIERWITGQLSDCTNEKLPHLARLAEVWEKIVRAARDVEAYNLDRKPLILSVFGWLAQAVQHAD